LERWAVCRLGELNRDEMTAVSLIEQDTHIPTKGERQKT